MESPVILVTALVSGICRDCGRRTDLSHLVEREERLIILCPNCAVPQNQQQTEEELWELVP